MIYIIKEIFELDHGCEGLMPGEKAKVGVVLKDLDGGEHVRSVEDEYLYANDINEGDRVNENMEKIV